MIQDLLGAIASSQAYRRFTTQKAARTVLYLFFISLLFTIGASVALRLRLSYERCGSAAGETLHDQRERGTHTVGDVFLLRTLPRDEQLLRRRVVRALCADAARELLQSVFASQVGARPAHQDAHMPSRESEEGAGAEAVHGVMENTQLFHIMVDNLSR